MRLRVFDPLPEKLGFKDKEIKLPKPTRIRNQELSNLILEDYFLNLNKIRIATPETRQSYYRTTGPPS